MAGDFKLTCIDPVYFRVDESGKPLIMYPCGKCVVCKEKKRRQWAIRMENEKSYSKSVYFVTLTYSDDNLYYLYPDCPASVSREHYQKFLKRLRKSLPFKFRMFGVAEYGSDSARPHYHFMIFCPEYIKKYIFREYITKCWKLGFNTVKNGVVRRMYYIAKYTVKGSDHPFGTETPFQTSSLNPPIGFQSFNDNLRILDSDVTHNYIVSPSGRKSSIPRSFENKYKERIDNFPRGSLDPPSLVRKHALQRQAAKRLKEYLRKYNEISPVDMLNMRDSIQRRYDKKHKKSTNL